MFEPGGPRPHPDVGRLAKEAASCERCPLYARATQLVFGEGPAHAPVMFVGEQPGDQEDRSGRPFVGPAGGVLDTALREAGLARSQSYVTNVVKHFKWEEQGKRRLHKRPNRYETEQCRWWLDQELLAIDPKLIVALGAFASSALMKRPVVLRRERGKLLQWADGRSGLATIHPSAVLRAPDSAARALMLQDFIADLEVVVSFAA
ncbi:MAG TPA: UdgX family uracil-DNA binding protein [Methylocystis sp.]|nr:UdgX family uracil-DNA binding protein [Methylocystis sp.]